MWCQHIIYHIYWLRKKLGMYSNSRINICTYARTPASVHTLPKNVKVKPLRGHPITTHMCPLLKTQLICNTCTHVFTKPITTMITLLVGQLLLLDFFSCGFITSSILISGKASDIENVPLSRKSVVALSTACLHSLVL